MRRSFLLILSFFCAQAGSQAIASGDQDILSISQRLSRQADERQLAAHETWLALLHYKRETLSRRVISQVDDAAFFLDENGKTDAKAELRTDLQAFFIPVNDAHKQTGVHAQCLFPARWWWLKQQLSISDDFDVPCPKLEAFMKQVAHDRLFLVFPSMYLNNPGSTFGHTFLRFDDQNGSILLSQTLNYAARVDHSDNIMSYIGKGLFGGYTGFFRARKYFETVQEYSNIENRDIWEYQLDFSRKEIEQLVRHVWEVKGIDFDYYFFRENCAYRLLALIDTIRPGMKLTGEDKFPLYAIPVDTVRALEQANLIQSRQFRASLATQIDDNFVNKDARYTSLAVDISSSQHLDKEDLGNKLQILASVHEQLAVLNQSYRLLQFNAQASSSQAQIILQSINELTGRQTTKTLQPGDSEPRHSGSQPTTAHLSPETGHDSMQLATGYGAQNSLSYIDIKFRPAFHDLLDNPQGYVNGAAINIFEARVKWFVNNHDESSSAASGLRLESLSLFNMKSLSPLSRWRKPVSWMLDFRFDRTQLSQTRSVSNFISRGGAGLSLRTRGITPFLMLTGEWNLASAYDKGYSLLLGVQAGVHMTLPSSQLMLSYQIDNAVSGFELDRKISQLQWQYNIKKNHAVRLLYKHISYRFFNDEDWSINYHYYF